MAFFQGVVDYFDKGGVVMWPLLILFCFAVLVTIERAWHYSRATINTRAFLEKIHKVISQRRIKDALSLCEKYRGPIASILKAGLLKYEKGVEEMEKAIEGSGGLEMARLERGLVWLATIANIGPLLGFLGTVCGMIKSFDAIARAGLSNPSLVAIGISEALITTATGLIIAIPILAAYNYFTTRVGKLVLEMEESSALLLEYVTEAGPEGGSADTA